MLVLSRKIGETISIGDNVTVKVVRTQGGRVQIAIDAPREVAIRRGELAVHSPASEESGVMRRACA